MSILLLMYLLMIERKSPGLSAFWSTIFMLFILLMQNPLKAFFRHQGDIGGRIRNGLSDIAEGMIAGARNMIGRAAAMGAAGIFMGAVTLTGIGPVQAVFVFIIALIAMPLFAAGTLNGFRVKSGFRESAALLVAAFVLFQPGYFLNQRQPEFEQKPGSELFALASAPMITPRCACALWRVNLNGDRVDARCLLSVGAANADGAADRGRRHSVW